MSSQMLVNMTRADLEAIVQNAVQAALSSHALPAVAAKKAKKEKKEKDPNAPKKEPNAWVNFTQHVRSVLLAGGCELKGFVGQQYCSVLKAKLPLVTNEKGKQEPDYEAISDAEILSGFKSWTPPEQSKAAVAKASKPSTPEASPAPVPVPAAPEKKARKPQSAETKAAAAAKRAATKAAKAAAPAPVAASPPKAPEPEGDITEFAPTIIKGKPYLRNCRGDILSEEYDWVGRYNEATKTIDTKFPKPEDLDE